MGLIHYENDFSTLIKDRVVVDFYATWCGPCRMFGPVFEEVSKDKDFNFVKLDVDKYSDIAREYGVMSIPTVILFENGNEVKRFTGFMSKDEFIEFLK
ncbi:MAG: thioredoxin [Bacilli bacterium]